MHTLLLNSREKGLIISADSPLSSGHASSDKYLGVGYRRKNEFFARVNRFLRVSKRKENTIFLSTTSCVLKKSSFFEDFFEIFFNTFFLPTLMYNNPLLWPNKQKILWQIIPYPFKFFRINNSMTCPIWKLMFYFSKT